ncbi:small ribosomal subunit protein uS7-like [Halichondria panicea]|uniref:small ribosomal subunit protein uS7-like n=1 Tax=Halichondria panicea TaxID=6063 RepID=UPI00312B6330
MSLAAVRLSQPCRHLMRHWMCSSKHGPACLSTEAVTTTIPERPMAPSSQESPSFFYDPVAQKFVNMMMWDGKKSLAQSILKEAFQVIKTTQLARLKSKAGTGTEVMVDPLTVFHQALENSKPIMGTIGVRRGGKLYQVPYPLPSKRRQFLASKWIITASRDRSGHNMAKKLAAELLEAFNNQGTAIKRKQDLHRLAEANRAFAHYRW